MLRMRKLINVCRVFMAIFVLSALFIFYSWYEKFPTNKSGGAIIEPGVATILIGLLGVTYFLLNYEFSKRQAILKMNEEFNKINSLAITNDEVRNIVAPFIGTAESSSAKCCKSVCCKQTRTHVILMLLNTYESYFINNGYIFPGNKLPAILKSMLNGPDGKVDQDVKHILISHEYHPDFIKECEHEMYLIDNKIPADEYRAKIELRLAEEKAEIARKNLDAIRAKKQRMY